MRGVFLVAALAFLLALVFGVSSAQDPKGKDQPPKQNGPIDPEAQADEEFLQKANVPTDGKGLLEYFKKRTFALPDPKVINDLIKQLGDADFHVREQAFTKLIQLGPGAVEKLKQASVSDDVEVKKRAMDLLKQQESEADPLIQAAVARLIGQRKPAGASEVLLAYMPFVSDEAVVEDIINTLGKVSVDKGQADAVLLAALKDQLSSKRRAAGLALARSKDAKHSSALLAQIKDDPDMQVRLDVALELGKSLKEKQAVPALIDLLDDLPSENLWQAEYILQTVAGKDAPKETLGVDLESRKKCQTAWEKWWQGNKDNVKLDSLSAPKADQGSIIVVHQTTGQNVGGVFSPAGRKIVELDKDKKERWQFVIHNTNPVSAQVYDRNQLLLVEETGRRVSFRDLLGRIEKTIYFVNNPISGSYMTDGKFFVAFRNEICIVDRNGTKPFSHLRQANDIYRGCLVNNNTAAFLTGSGTLNYLDLPTQKTLKSFDAVLPGSYYGGMDSLPNGNVLIPAPDKNQVIEYNSQGKVVRRFPVPSPTTAVYMPNGHILVGSQTTNTVSEINRQGKVFWSQNFSGSVFQVSYR